LATLLGIPIADPMASPTKRDKGAAAPEARECANCLAKANTQKGQGGVTLTKCTKCKLTFYCGRACQKAHWTPGAAGAKAGTTACIPRYADSRPE
jgi:hypothetical protein